MSVTRLNEFQAKTGQEAALKRILSAALLVIWPQSGCRSWQLLQSRSDPAGRVVLEVWDSIEAHQASVKSIPPESIAKVMLLLATPPKGDYYGS